MWGTSMLNRPIGDPCSKRKGKWKFYFENLNLKPFANVINVGVY
jgi:hypothetical protein